MILKLRQKRKHNFQISQVVQLNESNRKGKLSRWRQEAKKKKDRERKRREKRKKERPHGGVARKNNKGIAICSKIKASKTNHPTTEKDAMRNYITQHVPGTHLTFEQRQTLGADWNRIINAGCRITLRQFAAKHGLRYETWRREYLRGATGFAIIDPKDRRRRKYCEYDPFAAQDKINENNENKGTKMRVTNQMAFLFKKHVLEEKLSPYDAICHMKKEMPGQRIPCLSTWYKHINTGDVGVRYGETPYHPKKKPKRPKPHPAKTVPGRLTLNDRPDGANKRSRFGHYEMDTIVSSTNGRGGLLVLIDRKSRRYIIELLAHVTQDEVVAALKRMIARKSIGKVISITTDNGCEFLDPKKIKEIVGCNVYYTRAYASWEKGTVENCNKLVRRWYPKGTDFSRYTRADMHKLEHVINSIHRKIFNGKTAYEMDSAYAQVS